ncbi:MAG: hypothetical protein HQ574_04725 [Chloroflexi bacterium]|nr:hypothetical protein [Chloroflexota bacterium]
MVNLIQSLLVGLLFICGTGILMVPSKRLMTGLLALQYVGVFLLVSISWPMEIAVVKLVAGWMAAAVLFITYENLPSSDIRLLKVPTTPGTYFKAFSAFLIGISVYSLVPVALRWFLGASSQQVLGGLCLFGLGLLQLGLSRKGIRIIIGLLTVISGFEILYATLEASVLMTGLLAILNIGLAFVGAYLLMASNLEENL